MVKLRGKKCHAKNETNLSFASFIDKVIQQRNEFVIQTLCEAHENKIENVARAL